MLRDVISLAQVRATAWLGLPPLPLLLMGVPENRYPAHKLLTAPLAVLTPVLTHTAGVDGCRGNKVSWGIILIYFIIL